MSFWCKQQTTNKPFGTAKATAVFIFSLIVNYYLIFDVLVTILLLGIYREFGYFQKNFKVSDQDDKYKFMLG